MAGLIQKPTGAVPGWDPFALSFRWPVRPLYAGWYGSTVKRSLRNLRAPRQTPAVIVGGTPTADNAGLTLIGSTGPYIQTTVAEVADLTLLWAGGSAQDQSSNALRTAMMGWPTTEGLSLYSGGANLVRIVSVYNGTAVTVSWNLATGYANTPRLLAVVRQAGVGIIAYDLTAGTSQSFPNTAIVGSSTGGLSTSGMRVGAVSGGPGGTAKLIFAAAIPTAMTAAQLPSLRTLDVAVRAAALNGVTL